MKLSLLLATTVTAQFTAQISLLENSPLMTTTYIGNSNETSTEFGPLDIDKRLLENIPERQLSEPLKQAVEGMVRENLVIRTK